MIKQHSTILAALQDIFEEALLEGCVLDPDENYAERGVDSILAAQLAGHISSQFAVTITSVDIFDARSLHTLASVVGDRREGTTTGTSARADEIPASDTMKNAPSPRDVVIVGASARFSGADSVDGLHNVLDAARVATGRVGEKSRTGEHKAGFLPDIDRFDAGFFRISPKEAECIDPQQRVFLEAAWHAIEDSGLSLKSLRDLGCGVFVTSLPGDYRYRLASDPDRAFGSFGFTGNAVSALAGRLAYVLDLNGPTMSIDTACSSSLVALQEARLNILAEQCEAAIVGGVSVFSTDEIFRLAAGSSMLAADGSCRTFAADATGFAPAEGAGALILTTRSVAEREGLAILAEIAGGAVRHDGRSNGLMSPSSSAQIETIRASWRDAENFSGFDPRAVGYVECHGTGTPIGDPIETRSLAATYGSLDDPTLLPIGAVKANIGHSLVASGLAGIVKLILCFERDKIFPQVGLDKINSAIALGRMVVNRDAAPFPPDKPFAAISAFGFAGTNAHVILRKPRTLQGAIDADALPRTSDGRLIFVFSAYDAAALRRVASSMVDHLLQNAATPEEVCAALWRRPVLPMRVAMMADDIAGLVRGLLCLEDGEYPSVPVARSGDIDPAVWPPSVVTFVQEGRVNVRPVKPSRRLPPYPFARDRYWVDDGSAAQPVAIEEGHEPSNSNATDRGGRADKLALDEIRTRLKARLGELLGSAPKDVDDTAALTDLGLDSLSALKLLEPFQGQASAISMDRLFDGMNLDGLARLIIGEAPGVEPIDRVGEQRIPEPGTRRDTETQALMARLNLEDTSVLSGRLALVRSRDPGRPILLLPPLNTNFRAFARQIPFLQARDYAVHIPCYYGHDGISVSTRAAVIDQQADLIAEYASTIGRPPVVGWSLGGCLALAAETRHPSTFGRMILVSSVAWLGTEILTETIHAQSEFEADSEYFDLVLPGSGPVVKRLGGGNLAGLNVWLEDLQRIDMRPLLSRVSCLVMIVNGRADRVIGHERIAPFETIGSVRFETFEEAGHYAPLTEPRRFNAIMNTFLAAPVSGIRATASKVA